MNLGAKYAGLKTGCTVKLNDDAKPSGSARAPSPLEEQFSALWHASYPCLARPEREYHFDPIYPRRRLDFAWPKLKLAVEIEGGMYVRGRHQRARGYTNDCRKYNAAVLLGWRVLRYTTLDMKERPMQVVAEVASQLNYYNPSLTAGNK